MEYLLVSRISEPSTAAVVCVADHFRCFVADTSAIILLYRCCGWSIFPCECGMLKFSNVQNIIKIPTHSFIKPGWPNWLNYPYLEDRIVHMIKMIKQFLMTTPATLRWIGKKTEADSDEEPERTTIGHLAIPNSRAAAAVNIVENSAVGHSTTWGKICLKKNPWTSTTHDGNNHVFGGRILYTWPPFWSFLMVSDQSDYLQEIRRSDLLTWWRSRKVTPKGTSTDWYAKEFSFRVSVLVQMSFLC